jgi:hypothetical protein
MLPDLPGAEDQARPCRPTISCTADIVAPGSLEVEVGTLSATSSTGPARAVSFPLLLKQTLLPWLQLQVGSNGYTQLEAVPPLRYFDNVIFGPKLHLNDQGDVWPSLSLSAQASLPASSAAGYTPVDDLFLTAFASKDVGRIHADLNVGAFVWRVEDAPATQAFTALALSTSLPPPLGLAVEGYYFAEAGPLAPHDGGVRAALSVNARSWLVLDGGGDVGFFPATRAYSVFLGVTMIPLVLWRSETKGAK